MCIRDSYKTRVKFVSLPQEFPRLTGWLGRFGLLPYLLPPLAADRTLDWDSETWALTMQDQAEEIVRGGDEQELRQTGEWYAI